MSAEKVYRSFEQVVLVSGEAVGPIWAGAWVINGAVILLDVLYNGVDVEGCLGSGARADIVDVLRDAGRAS